MKYKYSKIAFICCAMVTGFISFALLFFYGYIIGAEEDQYLKVFFICSIFFAFCVFMFTGEYTNKYVELFDESVRFNSFRFKDVRMKKAIAFSVKYEDIISVNVRTLPIIGIWAISIKAKNLPQRVTVSFCFKKHREFYYNFCKRVENKNPNAYIDKRLKEYIERKKHE